VPAAKDEVGPVTETEVGEDCSVTMKEVEKTAAYVVVGLAV